ncbi:MAG: DUF3300 domain-containing protein [Acetobacteraceae bacterium]|nr:DUF3300 domain-containing protein [Acetobacteraceae bacterium]
MEQRSRKTGGHAVWHLRRPGGRALAALLAATTILPSQFLAVRVADAQTSATQRAAGAGGTLSPAELDQLVARIALYSDPLLAIVLPASTEPAEIVEAKRFLGEHSKNPSATPPSTWDPSVVSLLNYPDVIRMMDSDLDWTQQLGNAVITQQQDVMAAIQRFRQRSYAAGNLTSNSQVTVAVQNAQPAASTAPGPATVPATRPVVVTAAAPVIQIQSANPTVLYVPQYDPAVVVNPVAVGGPPPFAYSPPYPAYVSPAAPFFTGAVFGAAVGFGLSWASGSIVSGALGGGGNVTNVNVNNINNHFNTFQHNGANIWHPAAPAVMNANNHGLPPPGTPNPNGLLYSPHNPTSGSPQPQPSSAQPAATASHAPPGQNPSLGNAENRRQGEAINPAGRGESPQNGAGNRGPSPANTADRGGRPQNGGENGRPNQAGAAGSDEGPRNGGEGPRNGGEGPRNGGENQFADRGQAASENRPGFEGGGRRSMANAGPGNEPRGGSAFAGIDQPRSQAERAQERGNASLHRPNSGPPRRERQAANGRAANERRR